MTNCIGTHWRYRENKFINAKGEIVNQYRIRLLKSKSCNGKCQPSNHSCESEFASEFIHEHLAAADLLPELPKGIKDGDELVLRFSFSCDDLEDIWFIKAE